MRLEELDRALDQIEVQLDGVAQALAAGDAVRLEAASTDLQRISVGLSRLVEDGSRDVLRAAQERLHRIAGQLAIQREGLLRQAGGIERALGVLMPAAQPAATYRKPAGAHRYAA